VTALLDTHTLIWWLEGTDRLSDRARATIASRANRILVSAAVGWELAIKVNSGKITPPGRIQELDQVLKTHAFVELPISLEHSVRAGLLPPYHRDPFDRMLVAQAQSLNVPILSADRVLDQYDVKRLW
jgi:PIN domain nuclease of toxin-antitoxin system